MNEETIGADASLAAIAVFRGESAFDRRIQVGVFKDNEGGIAAKLHRQALQCWRRLGHEQTTDLSRTGERELAHAGIRGEGCANGWRGGRIADDDVEHTGGNAGPCGQYGQGQRRQRGLLGRFDDGRTADGEGWGHFTRDHGCREVPRSNRGANTHRFARDQ